MRRDIEVVTAEWGAGAQITGCRLGPDALRAPVNEALRAAGALSRLGARVSEPRGATADRTFERSAPDRPDVWAREKMDAVAAFAPLLAAEVAGVMARQRFPLVVGGDHSCAVGTWSGVAQAVRSQGTVGLVWIDAHLDSHTPETSESQAPHGMPLAALLGHGAPALTGIGGPQAKLAPETVVVLGARSYEPGEAILLESLGVRVIDMHEVAARGVDACLKEAVAIASRAPAGFGVSFDTDVIDPLDAQGVGSPVAEGIRAGAMLEAMHHIAQAPGLRAFELVEYNPLLDDARVRTANFCTRLIVAALRTAVSRAAARDAIASAYIAD